MCHRFSLVDAVWPSYKIKMYTPNPVIETERLILRWLTVEDASFVLKLLNDPSFIMNIADRGVRTIEAAEKYIEEKFYQESYKRLGFGTFLVILKETYEPIGLCSLVKRDSLRDIDIGYAFLPLHTGQGLAFEATLAVLNHCRDVLKLKRVVAITNPTNVRSVALLQRIGLKFEEELNLPEGVSKLFAINFDQN